MSAGLVKVLSMKNLWQVKKVYWSYVRKSNDISQIPWKSQEFEAFALRL